MRRNIILLMFVIVLVIAFIFSHNSSPAEVMAVEQTPDTVLIAVKGLPYSTISKLDWWLQNKNRLIYKYKLGFMNLKDQPSVYIYDFSGGFKKEEIKDRLCFDNVPPPSNCIDKKILMIISQIRNGDIRIAIDDDVFIQEKNGEITKLN